MYLVTKIKKGMIRWFEHVQRIDTRRLTEEIYEASVTGIVGRHKIGRVLEKGQIKSTLNRQACMKDESECRERYIIISGQDCIARVNPRSLPTPLINRRDYYVFVIHACI